MRPGRFALACAVLFVVAVAWNGFVHGFVLRDFDGAVAHLQRADLADRLWLGLLVTAGMIVLFVAGYTRVARVGSALEGAGYGVFFACLTGVLVDLNQYMLYPIPARVAFVWFLGGVVEFVVYGVLVSRLYGVGRERANA